MNLPMSAKRNIEPNACIISENAADTNTKYNHSSQADGHPESGRTPKRVTPIVSNVAWINEVICQTNVLPKNVLNVPLEPLKYLLFLITNVEARAPAHNDIDIKNGENPFPYVFILLPSISWCTKDALVPALNNEKIFVDATVGAITCLWNSAIADAKLVISPLMKLCL